MKKTLRVGILDLIARQPTRSIYARLVNPNYTSLMPQCIAVWAEELGHKVFYRTYTGFEDILSEMPQEIDILFISTFTQNALTAYSISNMFRKKGIITVLGGPHARAYADDSAFYFDYVLGLTDKKTIDSLLNSLEPQPQGAIHLSAPQQPKELPPIRARWKFLEQNLKKTRLIHVVPMIGSLGCPYTCGFCIDARIDYQTLPYEQIREDLRFLQGLPKPPTVAWYDPNFGIRFDDYLDIIESSVKPGTMAFGAESSLSLLSEPNLKRLKKNNFIVMLPGIESWFDFNGKSKQQKNFGLDKVKAVSEQVNMVLRHVPYVQVNFIFGLDQDAGPLPFELTKRFIDLTPGVYPNFAFLTAFGNSAPFNEQYQRENRVIDIPFPFLDGNSGLNVRLKNYRFVDFYDHMIDLVQYAFSAKRIYRRFKANRHPLPRWMNFMRATLSGKGSRGNYLDIRNRLQNDRAFQDFYSGESFKPPSYYQEKIRETIGPFYDMMPERVLRYLKEGEPTPNTRVSNALRRQELAS